MSYMRPDLVRNSDKPPAAIAGSPGTSIFLPPPPSSRTSTRRPLSPTKPDRVPIQWSFESSYGFFGSGTTPTRRPSRETISVSGMGSWFNRKRDRDCDKVKDKSRIKSPTSHAKSVDAPDIRVEPEPAPRTPTIPARTPPRDTSHRLPSIPASNAPTPRPSRAPSPVASPPPNFRPTSTHRPGSSAGFKPHPRPPITRSRGVGSAPPPPTTITAPPMRRRPATSSGVPAARSSSSPPSPSERFLGGSLGAYGVGSSFTLSLNNGSTVSLAPVPGSMNDLAESLPPPPPPLPPVPAPVSRKFTSAAVRKAARMRGFVLKSGKRHHPRPREEAPYPRDYERKVLDHDVWEHGFTRQLSGSGTFHAFTAPPGRVLDLGCGTGTWVLDCARDWPDTHFIGLDLVPIQPDPVLLGLASRVHWVHANFLERLPFADGAFDFVHVRRIARGVPEDRWEGLFEEIARVLRGGGALEIIEEDLFFPGSAWMDDDDESGKDLLKPNAMHGKPVPVSKDASRSKESLGTSRATKDPPRAKEGTPRGSTDHVGRSFIPEVHASSGGGNGVQGDGLSSSESSEDVHIFHIPLTDPRDHSLLELAYTEMHAARFINLTPLSVLHSALVQYFRDVRSHAALQLSFPVHDVPHALLPHTELFNPLQRLVTLDTSRDGTANNLPNRHWHFDLCTLNMHLSARVTEVLACAEEMWAHITSSKRGPLAGVARDEWEECLARFEMDMQDRIGLGRALSERLAWRVRATPRTPERKAFDDAVQRWEHQQRRRGCGSDTTEPRGLPLSRRFRAFVAWKAQDT